MTTVNTPGDSEDKILTDLRALIQNSPTAAAKPIGDWSRADQAEVRAIEIAWGWLMRVLRTTEAIRVLETLGYAVECAPMRRSVVEHVIRLHWATTIDAGVFVEAALNHRNWSLGKVTRAGESGTPLPEGAAELIEALRSETDTEYEKISFMDLTSLMEAIPNYEVLFKIWLTETQESHATMTSSSAYVDFDHDEPSLHLHMEPESRNRFDALLPSLVLLATESYARLANLEDQLNERLGEIRERVTLLGRPKATTS